MIPVNFKDQIEQDLDVFVNVDEFAEVHSFDGKPILMIIENDNLSERPRQPMDLYNAANGVYVAKLTAHFKASEIDYRPIIGQHIYLDGNLHRVIDSSVAAGLLTIVLEANEA